MDKFPDTLNRKTCVDRMAIKQTELIKETRKNMSDAITNYTEECNPIMILEFPDRLWHEHKIVIIKELLEKFGKLKVTNPQIIACVTSTISDIKDIPPNVKKITIEFPFNNE